MSMKAEVMTKILNDAKEAKPIDAIGKNTYDAANYNKVRGEKIMMANLQDAQNGFYTPTYMPGDVGRSIEPVLSVLQVLYSDLYAW